MFEPAAYLAFLLAALAVVLVPGPTVTVIIANALRHGTWAGLANVAGTQLGLALMMVVLALGLDVVIGSLGLVFEVLRVVGALYLVWLGLRLLIRRPLAAPAVDPTTEASAPPRQPPWRTFFLQGLVVVLANPKALLFFGAFIPQFLNPAGDVMLQTLVLGGTFMVLATVSDGAYAVLAGRARHWMTARRVRALELGSGSLLIGGGVWLGLRGVS